MVTTLMSITVWYTDSLNRIGVVVAAAGYSVIIVLVFYFTVKLVEKETKLERAQFMQARLKNQRELVENILASDRSYRRAFMTTGTS